MVFLSANLPQRHPAYGNKTTARVQPKRAEFLLSHIPPKMPQFSDYFAIVQSLAHEAGNVKTHCFLYKFLETWSGVFRYLQSMAVVV